MSKAVKDTTELKLNPNNHLLGINGMSRERLLALVSDAHELTAINERDIKKVPSLRGRTVLNVFAEPSTRTRTSFELAAKRLSADAVNISASSGSTMAGKGETLLDLMKSISAMSPDVIVFRHKASGAPHFIASRLQSIPVVNAGDGLHEHPTQALLDCLTILKNHPKGLDNIKISIVGDIRHSRVARSNILAHMLLGSEIRLVGPTSLVPYELASPSCYGNSVKIHRDLKEGIKGADIIMLLRVQNERMSGFFLSNVDEYSRNYGLSIPIIKDLAPDCKVLHPGPLNRGVEINTFLADSEYSCVEDQIFNGVAVRMAVLLSMVSNRKIADNTDKLEKI